MKTFFSQIVICTFCSVMFFSTAMAETVAKGLKLAPLKEVPMAQKYEVKLAKLKLVKAALLHRVDEGVFQLKLGQSIDLTDRKVLFTFRGFFRDNEQSRKDKHIYVYINGDSKHIHQGDRIDLKKHKKTHKYFEGNEECFIDYVDLIAPKGAPAVGTFRLHCE